MKKVLIITYYWPPAGGPGVQRWLKFVKYLPQFGIEPIVFIPKNPNYPIQDESLNREVSNQLTIIKRPILEPYKVSKLFSKSDTKTMSSGIIEDVEKQKSMQKLMLYVRGNYFIPDARILWVNPSIKFLQTYLQKHNIQNVITTGPPHSLHLIGKGLKEKIKNLKWIADFRDPWVNIDYHSQLKLNDNAKQKHKELEDSVLNEADQIIVTSFKTAEEFRQKTNQPIEVITNGYDETENLDIDLSEAFSLVHVGSLLSQRNPENLWKVLQEFLEENKHLRQFLELHFVGKVSQTVLNSIEAYGLKDYVYLDGYLPHLDAIKAQKSAQLLLLIEANNPVKSGIIPGKLFEYLMAKRPILAVGPTAWDVQKIIEETQSGTTFNYQDKKSLKQELQKAFQEFLQGKLCISSKHIEAYSRKSLTHKLSKLI
ncbi:glycosyltransferase family 4 protein [Psychroflexus salis]|uniref:Glycosyl transferase family 1 n=1 Tax=Psychroflexus salis TaxID=1526574 RepID=A0A917E7P3_9FLAO|nr:glycosyltransferase family 4 protein [Psychroflexus salis]GGE11352.1 glycosyl transferase family 1 [Psychroflexus salis]